MAINIAIPISKAKRDISRRDDDMAFSFNQTLSRGKGGTKNINALLANFVTAIADYFTSVLGAGSIVTNQLAAAAVTGAKISADALTPGYVSGVDTTSAADDLTITGITADMRIMFVLDTSGKNVVDKSWFTPIAGGVTQEIGHALQTASLLFIFLPAAA
jgi:hypothetical protein